jgi:hypothetical protein
MHFLNLSYMRGLLRCLLFQSDSARHFIMQFYTSLSLSVLRAFPPVACDYLVCAMHSLRLHAIFNNILFNWEIIIIASLARSSSYA